MPQTVVKNILVNYKEFGSNQKKKTLLILHGWMNDLTYWNQISLDLTDKVNVVLIDLPGFGGSTRPGDTWGVNEYADFVAEFTKKINIKKFSMLGHSVGGRIAIDFAARYTNHLDQLFLVAPSGVAKTKLIVKTKIVIFKILANLSKPLPSFLADILFNIFASKDYINSGDMTDIFKRIVRQRVVEQAKKVTVNTVILWGENDKEVDIEDAKTLNQLIKNSVVRVIWNAGHSPQLEQPMKFIAVLREYL